MIASRFKLSYDVDSTSRSICNLHQMLPTFETELNPLKLMANKRIPITSRHIRNIHKLYYFFQVPVELKTKFN